MSDVVCRAGLAMSGLLPTFAACCAGSSILLLPVAVFASVVSLMARKRDSAAAELSWPKEEPEEFGEEEDGQEALGVTDVADFGAAWDAEADGNLKAADEVPEATPEPPWWKKKEEAATEPWWKKEEEDNGQWWVKTEHHCKRHGWQSSSSHSGGRYVADGWVDGGGQFWPSLALEE